MPTYDEATVLPKLDDLHFGPKQRDLKTGRESMRLLPNPLMFQLTARCTHVFERKQTDAFTTAVFALTESQAAWFEELAEKLKAACPTYEMHQLVKPPHGVKGMPTLHVKFNARKPFFKCSESKDESGSHCCTPASLESLERGLKVSMRLSTNALWFQRNTFGLALYADNTLLWDGDEEWSARNVPSPGFAGIPLSAA